MEKTGSSVHEPLVSIHWQHIVGLALRRIPLFAACFAVVMLITIVYLLHAPRLYESTGTLQVPTQEQRQFRNPDQTDASNDDLRGDDVIKTIEQNLQNFSLFEDVANDTALTSDPHFLEGFPSKDRPVDPTDLARWIQGYTHVQQRHGTRLIDISFEHRDPAVTQKTVRALIDAFFLENAKAQTATEQADASFLVTQSDQVSGQLQKSENSLQIYKDALLLKDRIEDQQRVIDALRQRYREKHPQLIQGRALMADLMKTFDSEFQKVAKGHTSEGAYWAANDAEISSSTPANRIPIELKLVEARANVLQMEVDTESALYDSVLKQHGTADVSSGALATQVRISQDPDLPMKPAKPRKTITLAVGALLGVILGAAAVFGANALDSTIKTLIEAEELLGMPVLGAIPLFVTEDKTKGPPRTASSRRAGMIGSRGELVVQTDPASGAAEGFRSLRAAIGLLGKSKDHRSILFTSALPDEGKTFVSCNYALAVSQIGIRTLLIDIDLRRPSVHEVFNLQNKNGFVEMVTQGLKLEDAVYHDVARNLDVLTSGARCPNPAELLSGTGFNDVLVSALKSYERVVVDCSPINLVSDSLLIAAYLNSVCLVVRAAETNRRDAQHALNLLDRAEIKLSGIVLNAVPPWSERLYPHYLGERSAKYRDAYRYVYQG
jgi:succinoglycan biosynthesis transport protein ExoP